MRPHNADERPFIAATITHMWSRGRQHLIAVGAAVLALAWFVGAVAIATGPLGVEARRGNLWIVTLIYLAPVAAVIVGEELIHRLKNGRQQPSRHARHGAPEQDVHAFARMKHRLTRSWR